MSQFCLKWNSHMNNMMDVFKNLLSTESMVDVTLACDGLSLKAHKIVLSAGSPFFQSLFLENPCKHPIVILKDMKFSDLKTIVEFMYHGEVSVAQEQMSALMKTAEILRVKGLVQVTDEKYSQSSDSSQEEPNQKSVSETGTPPPSKRRRKRSPKNENSNEPKIKPISSDVEELSGDETMNTTNSQFSNMQSQVPLQSTPSHSSDTFHNSSSVISQDHEIDELTSASKLKFRLLTEKSTSAMKLKFGAVTEEPNAHKHSNVEMKKKKPQTKIDYESKDSTTYASSDTSNQQPNNPPDFKLESVELDPPMSPVVAPSHSNFTMHVDQSSTSPELNSYQDITGLAPKDSQNHTQGYPDQPSMKQHTCTKCSFVTSQKSDLSRHLLTHVGERPFVCSVCSRAFARNDHLKRHMNRLHPCKLK